MTRHRSTYVRSPLLGGTIFERAHTGLTLGVIALGTVVLLCGTLPR